MPRMTSTCNFCWGEDIENGLATREETPNHNRLVYPVYDNHRLFVFYACNKCEKEQRSKYDPVIFNDYKAYEQKVLENGESFD